jgi:hypothetical protein
MDHMKNERNGMKNVGSVLTIERFSFDFHYRYRDDSGTTNQSDALDISD